MAATPVTVTPVVGLPEITAAATWRHSSPRPSAKTADLREGDIVVITSKIVSKAEGRVVATSREEAIQAETVRVVAQRGATTIAQTRHGLVLAAAGVDGPTPPRERSCCCPRTRTSPPVGSARRCTIAPAWPRARWA